MHSIKEENDVKAVVYETLVDGSEVVQYFTITMMKPLKN
jgi:hypothetical protein